MHPVIYPCCRIGDYQIIALSDGAMAASLELLSGIGISDAEDLQHLAGVKDAGEIHINCYLIRGGGRTLLVDSGTGGHNNMGGLLQSKLRRLGVHPDEIDTLLLTHGHPDHIGGLLNEQGDPVFKHAVLQIHPLEVAYWQDHAISAAASERGKRNIALARRVLDAYAEKIQLFDEQEILPGISPVWLPGHTPGHTGFTVCSGQQRLLIWGDIVHFPHIQTVRPAVSVMFDVDPDLAAETRNTVLQKAVDEQLIIAGMHLDQTGFVRLRYAEGEYRIAPA